MFTNEQRKRGHDKIRLRSIEKIESGNYNNKSLLVLRTYLLSRRGNICETCGIFEWNHLPINLEVHHVDGNKDNHILSNVSLLCPNCHSQTDSFKGRNKIKKPS